MKERSKIDLKLWKRNKIYNIFSQYDDPYTGLISKIDVTNIITFLNDNDYSFYGTMVYLCLCVFNEIEEFKIGYGKNEMMEMEIYKYDSIAATMTVLDKNKNLIFTRYVEFCDNYYNFIEKFEIAKQSALNGEDYYKIPGLNNMNKVNVTCIPWVDFINFKDAVDLKEKTSRPKLCWGKYNYENGKYYVNVSLLVNHAFQDGYHMGLFFLKLQDEINNLFMIVGKENKICKKKVK